ncbi:MAG TPA: TlpA disulfide reductase family protein [Pirellulaceae bacterium]|nr:TlpA disulfide reductase family protein [Pirellulaceae bacterium]
MSFPLSFRRRLFSFDLASSALLAVGLVGCAPEATNDEPAAESPAVVVVGNSQSMEAPATEVTVRTVDMAGLQEVLDEHAGKVVLVDYWATWCGPCTEQFPHTVAKAKELGPRGFAAVSVSFDDPADPEPILEFLREQNAAPVINLVSAHGVSAKSNEEFEIGGGIPWYRLYDRSGELKYVFCDAPEPGVDALPVTELDAKIEELLAQGKP